MAGGVALRGGKSDWTFGTNGVRQRVVEVLHPERNFSGQDKRICIFEIQIVDTVLSYVTAGRMRT